jgi:hypothetical protein
MAAFAAVRRSGELTARAHFAPVIEPKKASNLSGAVARIAAYAKQYDEGRSRGSPHHGRNAKLFLDGVISAPALTGLSS